MPWWSGGNDQGAVPDGPPVDTVQEHSGGKFASCGGLPRNKMVYYDPDLGVQAFGRSNDIVGMVVIPLLALTAGVPGVLAWIHTLQKRRTHRSTPFGPVTRETLAPRSPAAPARGRPATRP